jgi:hypothetical protein
MALLTISLHDGGLVLQSGWPEMIRLRRSLASCALCVALLQVGLLFGTPLFSCCATAAPHAQTPDHDCCPAGSHAPGQCPLHQRGTSGATQCRLACAHTTSASLILVTVGTLPPSISVVAPAALAADLPVALRAFVSQPRIPSSPPPEA